MVKRAVSVGVIAAAVAAGLLLAPPASANTAEPGLALNCQDARENVKDARKDVRAAKRTPGKRDDKIARQNLKAAKKTRTQACAATPAEAEANNATTDGSPAPYRVLSQKQLDNIYAAIQQGTATPEQKAAFESHIRASVDSSVPPAFVDALVRNNDTSLIQYVNAKAGDKIANGEREVISPVVWKTEGKGAVGIMTFIDHDGIHKRYLIATMSSGHIANGTAPVGSAIAQREYVPLANGGYADLYNDGSIARIWG
jgi:hypothetical protein